MIKTHKLKPVYLSKEIDDRIGELAKEIKSHFKDEPVVVLIVLKGAFVFGADLVRKIDLPLTIDFIGISSYEGIKSTGEIKITKQPSIDMKNSHVIIVEDIVDSGRSVEFILNFLSSKSPKSVKVCSFLNKPTAREVQVPVDFCAFSIPDKFVVGYGLDLDQRYRELPYLAEVILSS